MSAHEVALAIADTHRPDLVVDGQVDVARAAGLRTKVSSGERTMLDLILSLCGEGAFSLHLLDHLDRRNRDLVVQAMQHL